ncbi:MAG: histidine phosphatase family protein [Myxococcota bacterium]|nr:histidine phosphatase family protein [Myxococcota bacterium]
MRVYLVQHGLAKSKDLDPARPLTDAGRDEAERVARAVAAAGVDPALILHSGKSRAEQTAEISNGAKAASSCAGC